MTMAAANTLNTALLLLEYTMLYILINGLFESKRPMPLEILSFAAAAAINCVVMYFLSSNYLIRSCILAATMTVWMRFCFRVSFTRCLFPVLFWLAYLMLCDNLMIFILGAIIGDKTTSILSSPDSYYLVSLSIKFVELFGITVLNIWLRHHFERSAASIADWLRVLIFPLTTLIVSILLVRVFFLYPPAAHELLICDVVLLILDVASIFILNYLDQQRKKAKDQLILRRSMKAALESVETWKKAYEQQRKQTHDFKNLLIVLRGFAERETTRTEMIEYIERLQHLDSAGSTMIETNRIAVDIILNQKLAAAEDAGIRFMPQLDDLSTFPLPDDELIIVLSNLIDNAIEACEKIEDTARRFIRLNMKVEPQCAYLRIENPTVSPVEIKNNRIITTKANAAEHGYGIQNMIAVLERHSAYYLFEYSEEAGTLSFTLQLTE